MSRPDPERSARRCEDGGQDYVLSVDSPAAEHAAASTSADAAAFTTKIGVGTPLPTRSPASRSSVADGAGPACFRQCPVRYGDFVAKLGAFPASPEQDALRYWTLEPHRKDDGHAVRAVHAKAHSLMKGTLTVDGGLSPGLAQGLFTTPGEYTVDAGDVMPDGRDDRR